MKTLIICASFVGLLFGSSRIFADAPKRPELELVEVWVSDSELEISGIARINGSIHIVSDGGDDTFLYKLHRKSYKLSFTKAVTLNQLKGFSDYEKSFKKHKEIKKKHRRFDMEGLALCGEDLFVVNERVREVFVIRNQKELIPLRIDFSGYKDLNEGGANAGFEGIAVDCANQILFVAKERDPRQLFKIDLKSLKVIKMGDFEGSDRQGQKVINPFDGKGLFTIGPDIADLYFENGFLYALERNTYEIAKIDPNTFKVISRVSYFTSEKPLYESPEPFGLSEALSMNKEHIYIGIDNNGFPLGEKPRKQFKMDANFSSIMVLKRPAGF